MIQINKKDGSLLALVIPTMPDSIRRPLLNNLITVFPRKLENTNSEAEGIDNFFKCLHLSWYNCYSTRARIYFLMSSFNSNNSFSFQKTHAPEDANSSTLTKYRKKCSNPAQFIPRTLKELQGNLEDYHQLQAIFEPLFEWIAGEVRLQFFLYF
jgi:hypothetical protein